MCSSVGRSVLERQMTDCILAEPIKHSFVGFAFHMLSAKDIKPDRIVMPLAGSGLCPTDAKERACYLAYSAFGRAMNQHEQCVPTGRDFSVRKEEQENFLCCI